MVSNRPDQLQQTSNATIEAKVQGLLGSLETYRFSPSTASLSETLPAPQTFDYTAYPRSIFKALNYTIAEDPNLFTPRVIAFLSAVNKLFEVITPECGEWHWVEYKGVDEPVERELIAAHGITPLPRFPSGLTLFIKFPTAREHLSAIIQIFELLKPCEQPLLIHFFDIFFW